MHDDDACGLAGGGAFLVQEVQRHADAQRLVLVDALEIQMQHELLERVALHVAQKHLLHVAGEAEVED